MTTSDRPLPYYSDAHQLAHQFLVEEAHLLDTGQLEEWLALLCDDIVYVMPTTVTTANGSAPRQPAMDHFREDLYSLRLRVARLRTEHAWAEDPRSRTRHLVSNVRTFDGPQSGELQVESALLLFRSRGDDRAHDLVSAGRTDVMRSTADGELRLASRHITVDESVLRTQNLAVLL